MYCFGEEVGDLLEDGGLADAALPVDDEDMINEFACQAVFDPVKDILAPEEHTRLYDGCSSDIRIAKVVHCNKPTL
ncbi:MAG: hypothetical protein U9R53_00330 [Chloroflexota bacterium]|nr:hypothetical protein [Chloroflexota bacterium]